MDLSWVHAELKPFYSWMGRPSVDPVLMTRMLIFGYVFAIRSERALCREVQVSLTYRWFCGLSIEDKIPDHLAFSRARNERFRDSGILRQVFAFEMPCLRHTSPVAIPASCSRRIPMICPSVNLDRFIVHLPCRGGLYPNLEEFAGLTSPTQTTDS